MNQAAVSSAQKRLDAIRNRVEFASKRWDIVAEAEAMQLQTGEDDRETIATIPNAANFSDRELVLNAPDDLIWLIATYDRLAARYRELVQTEARTPAQQEQKNYATECAMKCTVPAFKLYLHECHGLDKPLTDERVVIRVRSLLNIKSRSELNTDPNAAARWRDLVKAFDAWRYR